MNNTDTLEKIIRHQKNKDPAYPFREHLLMQLCIRTNKRMQDNISEFLGVYGINHSAYMVLTTLFAAENHGNDSNLLIVFYVQIMPDDFVMQLHRF